SRALSRNSRNSVKHGRTCSTSELNTASVINPRTRSAVYCGSCCRNGNTSSGGKPYFDCSAEVLTCTYTSRLRPMPCNLRTSVSATRSLSSAWNSAANCATSLALLVCKCPITAHDTSRSARLWYLRSPSWTLFSPNSLQRACTANLIRSSGTVLLTGSSRTSAASRPACCATE